MEMTPNSTESTTGLPLGLPDDVFNQVLEYLDGDALLASCRVDRSWAEITEGCSAAWRGAAGRPGHCRRLRPAPCAPGRPAAAAPTWGGPAPLR